jgi:hypothetical protein
MPPGSGIIRLMSSIPWSYVITAAGPLLGALGTVEINGRHALKRDKIRAEQEKEAAGETRQRDAYLELMLSSRLCVQTLRQLQIMYEADRLGNPPDLSANPDMAPVVERVGETAESIGQAVAMVEYAGSPVAGDAARKVYVAAGDAADFFTIRWQEVTAAGKKGVCVAPYEAQAAKDTIAALNAAIDQFIQATGTGNQQPRRKSRLGRRVPMRMLSNHQQWGV